MIPKFRVWDDVEKRMVILTPIDIFNTQIIDAKVMMGSGKKDKYGVEIFEGDIIYSKIVRDAERDEFYNHIEERKYKVIYEDTAFLLELSPYNKTYLREINVDYWRVVEFKIVGHIYEKGVSE